MDLPYVFLRDPGGNCEEQFKASFIETYLSRFGECFAIF